jgi:hypothetical protein
MLTTPSPGQRLRNERTNHNQRDTFKSLAIIGPSSSSETPGEPFRMVAYNDDRGHVNSRVT